MPSGSDLFDKLPDELISRIFTIGCELDFTGWNANADHFHSELEESGSYNSRKPYEFITKVDPVCSRFHNIVHSRGNGHYFYIMANPSGGGYDEIPAPIRDYPSFFFARFHRALRLSDGCDIHVHLKLGQIKLQLQDTPQLHWGPRSVAHCLRALQPYLRQVASIAIYAASSSANYLFEWVLRWFGSRAAFPRLQSLYVTGTRTTSPIELADMDLYDDLVSGPSNPYFPSLERAELLTLPDNSMPSFAAAQSLRSLTISTDSSSLSVSTHMFYDWASVEMILMSCQSLLRLEMVLRNAAPETVVAGSTPVSGLKQLILTADVPSFNSLISFFSFPHLTQANILIISEPNKARMSVGEPGARTASSFPSLTTLCFVDSAGSSKLRLRKLRGPKLDHLLIKTRPNEGESFPELKIEAPRRLELLAGPDTSPFVQIEPFDLSSVERLGILVNPYEVRSAPGDFLDGDKQAPQSEVPPPIRQIAMPRLKEIDIMGGVHVLNILPWLSKHFVLPSKFKLSINVYYTFDIVKKEGTGSNPELAVIGYSLPQNGHTGVHYGCNYGILPSSRMCNVLTSDAHVGFDVLASSVGVMNLEDCVDPSFVSVEDIDVDSKRANQLWTIFMGTGIISATAPALGGGTPFPHLKSVTVRSERPPDECVDLVGDLREMMVTRRAKGFPVGKVKVICKVKDLPESVIEVDEASSKPPIPAAGSSSESNK